MSGGDYFQRGFCLEGGLCPEGVVARGGYGQRGLCLERVMSGYHDECSQQPYLTCHVTMVKKSGPSTMVAM